MDCSPPGSSIHGIFQARVLEWGAIAFSGYTHYIFLKWSNENTHKSQNKNEVNQTTKAAAIEQQLMVGKAEWK